MKNLNRHRMMFIYSCGNEHVGEVRSCVSDRLRSVRRCHDAAAKLGETLLTVQRRLSVSSGSRLLLASFMYQHLLPARCHRAVSVYIIIIIIHQNPTS